MAKVSPNVIMQGISGKLGKDLVFRRMPNGEIWVQTKPDFSRRVLSAEQKAHHARLKAAAAYARTAARSNPIYAELAAGTMKTAYNLALADWFNLPVIQRIAVEGQLIHIRA